MVGLLDKPLVTSGNAKCRFHWCQQGKSRAVDNVKHVLFSDEPTVTVFAISMQIVEKPQICVSLGLLHGQSETQGWNTNGFGSNITALTTEPFQRTMFT